MKEFQKRKLLHYSAAAGAFLLGGRISGEIIYTDLDPDVTLGGEGADYFIDVNNDGVNDFEFFLLSYSGTLTYYGFPVSYKVDIAAMAALSGAGFEGKVGTYSSYIFNSVYKITPGYAINSQYPFVSGSANLAINVSALGYPYYEGGPWAGTDQQVFGFRIPVDEDYNYGWMRISVAADGSSITIHDYAYNTDLNGSIFATSTGDAITAAEPHAFSVFTSGKQVHVQTDPSTGPYTVKVLSSLGRSVSETLCSGSAVMDLSRVPTGAYLVDISQNDHLVKVTKVFLGR